MSTSMGAVGAIHVATRLQNRLLRHDCSLLSCHVSMIRRGQRQASAVEQQRQVFRRQVSGDGKQGAVSGKDNDRFERRTHCRGHHTVQASLLQKGALKGPLHRYEVSAHLLRLRRVLQSRWRIREVHGIPVLPGQGE